MVEVMRVTGCSGTERMTGKTPYYLAVFVYIFLLNLEKGFNFSNDPVHSCVQMNVLNFMGDVPDSVLGVS